MSPQLVTIQKEEAMTTSEVIAVGTDKTHANVIKLVRNHIVDLEEFGIIRFEIRKSKRGKPTEYCYLNETQTYFLITLMRNNKNAIKFKKELVREFMRMRKALIKVQANHQNEQWKQARLDGKAIRLETTDTIKEFVEYAVKQGSKNAVMYYSNITRMENKALFIMEQRFENVRQMLDGQQLSTLKVADKMVSDTLLEGMEESMHYKDIYKLAKKRLSEFSKLVKPTIVISSTELKIIKH